MNIRTTIDPSWIEIQTGLYLEVTTRVIAGNTYTFRRLHSGEGYCFYNVDIPENYDEEGNLKPPAERMYATYSTCAYETIEEINAHFISVPIEPGYEIVSVPNTEVTE
jgi:hypothetical protein